LAPRARLPARSTQRADVPATGQTAGRQRYHGAKGRAVRRHRSIESEAPGQDSFLDVVANLVGILVILIMVIGVRTRGAWQRTLAASPETNKLQQQVEQADAQLAAVARGNLQLQEEISQIEREALLRRSL